MATLKSRTNGSNRDYVYQIIKEQIINWQLKPGTKVSEKEIGNQLNVSRTPVREAFLKLAQEELIGIFPQSGTIISKIDLNLVEEGRFVREHIERAVVREACHRLDDEHLFQLETNVTMQELCVEKESYQRLFDLDGQFHRILFHGCNKIKTWYMVSQMNSHFDRVRMLRLASNPDWNVVVNQHKALFERISEKNAEEAEKLMSSHLKLINFEKEQLKEKYPSYFI
ncbi:GntR family transcriptional regulator [Aquibacillus salsiterrae]|uniref:GntR family transcriptional regulator n=1 Tax=Aquibacillus salsiterrae TaxID=2950439 RepID=A0A9X3WCV1_9BACI|nr:GntR family transcriptional regulator [Aquibacillus salsiterrae]MDC3416061.1 GntR family transcriptional regulator [Aquibacillus salsiterrae]